MRVLVTGHAGFIGSHVAEALLDAGHAVVGVDSLDDYYDPALKRANVARLVARGLSDRRLDLAQDPLDGVLDGVDVVIHLAAQPGISATTSFPKYLANNVVATQRLVAESIRAKGLRLFVNGATSSIYGLHATGAEETVPAPISTYGVTKLAAEQLVLAAARVGALPACSLRLYSVFGPRERPDKAFPRLLRACSVGAPFDLHEGSERHTRSFTYVADVAEAIVATIPRRDAVLGEIVNVGSDAETPFRRVLELVEATVGKPLVLRRVPPRPGDQAHTKADVGKARRLLGWAPRTSIEEGIRRTWRALGAAG
jgi:UDP-glucuronate 4-epimerase